MEDKKKSFVLYTDYKQHFDLLSVTERGELITALFEYSETGEQPQFENGALKMAFSFIKTQIDRDSEKWQTIRDRRAKAGKKGGIKSAENRKQKQANSSKCKQTQANQAVTVTVNDTVINKENIKKEKTDFFERFWSVYPKKQDKQTAIKAFQKLNPDEALLNKILSAIKSACNTEQWKKQGGQYIPMPSTYLNGRRWEDEMQISANTEDDPKEFHFTDSPVKIDENTTFADLVMGREK